MAKTIFELIYDSHIVEKVTNSILPHVRKNKEDFIQEMYLTIFEMPQSRLVRLYKSNQLYFYIVKIIRNQGTYPKSKFHKKYSQPDLVYVEFIENLEVIDE